MPAGALCQCVAGLRPEYRLSGAGDCVSPSVTRTYLFLSGTELVR